MAMRKIALMHQFFGVSDGHACRECCNFVKEKYHDRTLCKCRVYGMSPSEATDWAGRWQACGAFNREIRMGADMMEVVPGVKKMEFGKFQIEGQIGMEV